MSGWLAILFFMVEKQTMRDDELRVHPEGGRYKEVFRSAVTVVEGRRSRSALTHIYFSLNTGEMSRFHKVKSDEVWNLYEGTGLVLFLWDEKSDALERVELSAANRDYCFIVRAGLWQAAMPVGTKVLVGCSVAPGFEFEDFELIEPGSTVGKAILKNYPDLQRLVSPGADAVNKISGKKGNDIP